MRVFQYFRFSLVLVGILGITLFLVASLDAYHFVNTIVSNDSGSSLHFGFKSAVQSNHGLVIFSPHLNQRILPKRNKPITHDEKREQILSVFVEDNSGQRRTASCEGASHFQIFVKENSLVCTPTKGRFSRWIANIKYSGIFVREYLQLAQELFAPDSIPI